MRQKPIRIQAYRDTLAREIADLFHCAVHAIDASIYSARQKEAWAPTPPDYRAWRDRLALKQPFLALIDDDIAGFIELDPDGHIDCCFTHPSHQGKGVAGTLYRRLERAALEQGLSRLFVEASIVARPFFLRQDFVVLRENKVFRNGQFLINYAMEKHLPSQRQNKNHAEVKLCSDA